MSMFQSINEAAGQRFDTRPLVMADVHRLAVVAAYLHEHFLRDDYPGHDDWELHVRAGSLTFQRENSPTDVVKVFLDHDREITNQLKLATVYRDADAPIVVGVELSGHTPFLRHLVRIWLKGTYRAQYLDPTGGGTKYYIDPIRSHFYDLIVLPPGSCPASEELTAKYVKQITDALEKGEPAADEV